jgi:hypothetical protein
MFPMFLQACFKPFQEVSINVGDGENGFGMRLVV